MYSTSYFFLRANIHTGYTYLRTGYCTALRGMRDNPQSNPSNMVQYGMVWSDLTKYRAADYADYTLRTAAGRRVCVM